MKTNISYSLNLMFSEQDSGPVETDLDTAYSFKYMQFEKKVVRAGIVPHN